jgi:K+-transporting ATPase KdpF subunit
VGDREDHVSAGDIAGLVASVLLFFYLCYALFRAERF